MNNLSDLEKLCQKKLDDYNSMIVESYSDFEHSIKQKKYDDFTRVETAYKLLLEGTIKQFCNSFAVKYKCTPEEVRYELDRKDPVFTKFFEVYRMGLESNK